MAQQRTKACPYCAEIAAVSTRYCGRCGHRFRGRNHLRALPPEGGQAPPSRVRSVVCLVIGLLPLALIAVWLIAGSRSAAGAREPGRSAIVPVGLSAR